MDDNKDRQKYKIKFNSFDPRYQQHFRSLTENISEWRCHYADRAWWVEQELHCLTHFRKQGYDLHTGLYYCLINGHLYGWTGLASASLLLADAFHQREPGCWPPLAAKNHRKEIIEWYCQEVIDSCYGLSCSLIAISDYEKLTHALKRISVQAEALECRAINRITSLTTLLSVVYQTSLHREKLGIKTSPLISSQKDAPLILLSGEIANREYLRWRKDVYCAAAGFFLALCLTLGANSLSNPQIALAAHHYLPGNPLSVYWLKKIKSHYPELPPANVRSKMKDLLIKLEYDLVEAEQRRRPYLTISELKTSVYHLQQLLNQMDEPVTESAYRLQHAETLALGERKNEIDHLLTHLDWLRHTLYRIELEQN